MQFNSTKQTMGSHPWSVLSVCATLKMSKKRGNICINIEIKSSKSITALVNGGFSMRLISVRVRNFRNIIDSGDVEIHPSITCLVGKNESGKTAFLHALYRLNPVRPNVSFSIQEHYPAWLEKKDRQQGIDIENVNPITATFVLDDNDRDALYKQFGNGVVKKDTFTLSKSYNGTLSYDIDVSEQVFITHIINQIKWSKGTKTEVKKVRSIDDLRQYSQKLLKQEDNQELAQAIDRQLNERLNGKDLKQAVIDFIQPRIPRFLYFAEYSKLPYSVTINKILTTNPSELNDEELTARSLLKLAAAENEYLVNPDYERRKRELENVANALTYDVLKYWSQNPELRVQPDITQKTIKNQQGTQSVVDELKIRIWDQRHFLSLPFNEHSTGFQWFFSFLAAFSEYEYKNDPVIILLDEPALGLHARAQGDFLRFIDERLAPHHQVIYTTHSPFMIQPGKLDRVRLVEDKGQIEGAKVTADVTTTDPDTLFPLQGALGYDLVQNLFIAPHNLVVEGTSDFTYLRVISDYFKLEGNRTALDDKWSVVPVGGVDLIPTFVALLGNHLDVTVLIDSQKGGHQKLSRLVDQGILKNKRIIPVGRILQKEEADIEDLFEPSEYLEMFNNAFGTNLQVNDLQGNDRIVRRIARAIGKERFDHGTPADWFLRHRDIMLQRLSKDTLDRFEALFQMINATLPAE